MSSGTFAVPSTGYLWYTCVLPGFVLLPLVLGAASSRQVMMQFSSSVFNLKVDPDLGFSCHSLL